MNKWLAALICIVSFTVGNFLYQAIRDNPEWGVAFERSLFQAVGVLIFAWLYVAEAAA